LFYFLFIFFTIQNSKQHLKFLKLADLMRANGNKILWNVKTHWINMFNPAKQVMSMYMPLLAKMAENGPSLLTTKVNYELLCDVNLLIFLACLLTMLETIHGLMKFSQKWDIFACDYVQPSNFVKDNSTLAIQIVPRSMCPMCSKSSTI